MAVYLLHFEQPYKHARHYIGFAQKSVKKRIQQHCDGQGARLTQVVRNAGIEIKLARVWDDGDRSLEKRLKNRKNSKQLCPICNPLCQNRKNP